MKTNKLAKSLLISLAVLVGSSAFAGIQPGYYKGEFADKKDAKVFIQQTLSPSIHGGQEVSTYGLIIEKGSKMQAAIYRIEELEDGVQAWVQLVQNKDNILSVPEEMEASYVGRPDVDDKIRLSPTPFGQSIGCTREIKAERDSGYVWRNLPPKGFDLEDEDAYNGTVTPLTYSGKFVLNGITYQGVFSLQALFPGVSILRAQVLSAQSADGRMLEKKITAVVATVYRKRPVLNNYHELHMIELGTGAVTCLYADQIVEED